MHYLSFRGNNSHSEIGFAQNTEKFGYGIQSYEVRSSFPFLCIDQAPAPLAEYSVRLK
jgi:hypothetical protein